MISDAGATFGDIITIHASTLEPTPHGVSIFGISENILIAPLYVFLRSMLFPSRFILHRFGSRFAISAISW